MKRRRWFPKDLGRRVGVVLKAVPTDNASYHYYSYHEHQGDGSGRRKHGWRRQKGRLTAVRRLLRRRRKVN